MHEMALAESVVQIVEAQAAAAGAEKVVVVRLAIGALSHVEPAALEFCFEAVAAGGIAAGATLEIARSPAHGRCRGCGAELAVKAYATPCPACGSYAVDISGGQEMRVKDMEVE